MDELKAYRVKGNTLGDTHDVYLKSEADKVIALLTDKANYNDYAYKHKSEELADTCRFYEEELRHHKYKRCLAMANMCSDKASAEYAASYVSCDEYYYYHAEFWVKWHKRWLAIAEKFKPNSTAQ